MLKLNIGLSKKVGEADYGSRGASVNLELELDAGMVHDSDKLKERIRQLFHLARDSIQEELNGNPTHTPANSNHSRNGNGAANGNPPRPATQSQVRAIYAIARRQNIDLAALLQERFGCHKPDELSLTNASELIDELNTTSAGSRR